MHDDTGIAARLDVGVAVSVSDNSVDQWQVTMSMSDRLRRLFLDRPLLVLWTSLPVLPIVASLLSRRHRRRSQLAYPSPTSHASEVDRLKQRGVHFDEV
ncbi:MAG: hypothetical protein ACREX8_06000 [Gammaproteobacteria bacterium]